MQSKLSVHEIERLRREAKKIARAVGITHTEALDAQAVQFGYPNWALMKACNSAEQRRHPIFARTLGEMHQAFRKDQRLAGARGGDAAMRREMPDLSPRFANPMSALEYARGYLKLALSLPRFNPHTHSIAWIEMRVLLPYAFEPLAGRDRFIVVGRDYTPLGMANRDEHIDYERYKNLHVHVPTVELHHVTKHPDYSAGYLYGMSPSAGRAHAGALLKQIEAVMELLQAYERVD